MRTPTLILGMLGAAALARPTEAQNLYRMTNGGRGSLIADVRAGRIGDILTITVNEITQVRNQDRVERENASSLAARLEAYSLSDRTFEENTLPRFDVRKEQIFEGEARQEKDSTVRSSIAVIVVDVQPNGNLVVAGSRQVTVDDEVKTFRMSGIVRQFDIARDNTISSQQVADARISIIGEGGNTRQVTKGPVGTLVDTLIWAAWPF